MAVKGLALTLSALQRYTKEVQEDIKDAVEETTILIESEARRKAPAAGDPIKTQYGYQKNNTGINALIHSSILNNGFTGQVYISDAAGNLPVYIEVGTGSSAKSYVPTLPLEWQEVARRYFINGKGTIIAQPFLLPSFFEESPKLIKKIKAILRKTKI